VFIFISCISPAISLATTNIAAIVTLPSHLSCCCIWFLFVCKLQWSITPTATGCGVNSVLFWTDFFFDSQHIFSLMYSWENFDENRIVYIEQYHWYGTLKPPHHHNRTIRVSRCQKRTSGLYGALKMGVYLCVSVCLSVCMYVCMFVYCLLAWLCK